MKNKKLFITTSIFAFSSLLFTILVAYVDKQNIGPNDSYVGFASINNTFNTLIGQNEIFSKITKITGILIILIALFYFVIAVIQWIKRKSFLKIDKSLLWLLTFYLIIVAIYGLFELLKINFRPVLIDGVLEASYPSSHTMLAIFICTTAIFVNEKLISNKTIRQILNIAFLFIGAFTVLGRILSGVHWFTDIIGGILISTTLVFAYLTITYEKTENNKV